MSMSAVEKLNANGIHVDTDALASIARRYSIAEISVFGSSVTDHMREDSDVDLLVSFKEHASISLFDLMDLEAELSEVFGRSVDIVELQGLTNPVRRKAILSSKEPLYAA